MGLEPDAYWRQTPRLLRLVFKGRGQLRALEHNARAWLAWHTAYLPNTKTAYALDKLMVQIDGPKAAPRRKTRAELEAVALQWHAILSAQPASKLKALPSPEPRKRSRHAEPRSRRQPRSPPGAG